jgi:hypothetical protein
MIQYISTKIKNKQTTLEYLFEVPQPTLDEIIKSKVYHFQFTHDGSNVMVLPFKNPNVLQQMYDCLKHN